MTLDAAYNKIRECLGKLCDIEITPLPALNVVNEGVSKQDLDEQYIIASLARDLTCLYLATLEQQKKYAPCHSKTRSL